MAKKAPDGPMTAVKAAKLLSDTSRFRYDLSSVLSDFVTTCVLSIRNGFEPKDEAWDAREKQYLEIVDRYDREMIDAFASCMGSVMLLSMDGYADTMGELYMALGTNKKGLGQFFTPYHISIAMAKMTMQADMIDAAIAEKGHVLVNEPTCGAGGMVVAVAQAMEEAGYNPTTQLRVVAQDIDRICVNMTYVNCVLHKIPATILLGDAIKMEVKEAVHTPALWHQMAGIPLLDAA